MICRLTSNSGFWQRKIRDKINLPLVYAYELLDGNMYAGVIDPLKEKSNSLLSKMSRNERKNLILSDKIQYGSIYPFPFGFNSEKIRENILKSYYPVQWTNESKSNVDFDDYKESFNKVSAHHNYLLSASTEEHERYYLTYRDYVNKCLLNNNTPFSEITLMGDLTKAKSYSSFEITLAKARANRNEFFFELPMTSYQPSFSISNCLDSAYLRKFSLLTEAYLEPLLTSILNPWIYSANIPIETRIYYMHRAAEIYLDIGNVVAALETYSKYSLLRARAGSAYSFSGRSSGLFCSISNASDCFLPDKYGQALQINELLAYALGGIYKKPLNSKNYRDDLAKYYGKTINFSSEEAAVCLALRKINLAYLDAHSGEFRLAIEGYEDAISLLSRHKSEAIKTIPIELSFIHICEKAIKVCVYEDLLLNNTGGTNRNNAAINYDLKR